MKESYSGVVPAKQPNKGGRPSAEGVEERPLVKENTEQSNQCRTQSRESGSKGLERVREVAKKDGKVRLAADATAAEPADSMDVGALYEATQQLATQG